MKIRIFKIAVIFLFPFFCFPQGKVKEKEIVLEAKDCKIFGTLKVPASKQKVPVVLIIAGSGPTDRDGNARSLGLKGNTYKILSDSLNRHGIATLCYDKRGVGKSITNAQSKRDLHFEHFVEDAKAWIELLSQDKRFSEIIVLGHSEGSLVGMIACQNNPKASKFISVAGPGSPADEVIKEQLARGLSRTLREEAYWILNELKEGNMVDTVSTGLYNYGFHPENQPYMISWFKYNPQEEIAKLTLPVLILNGDLDVQVSEDEAELLHEAYPNAKKVIIEDMNHVLKNSESTDMNAQWKDSYHNPNTPVNQVLVKEIVGFVK